MREGLWDLRFGLWALGFGKVPPQILMSSFRACTTTHYTVHESCFDAICIVRIRLLAIVMNVFASTLYNIGINDDGMDYGYWERPLILLVGSKKSFVSFLKELGNKQNATLQSYTTVRCA